MPPSLPQNIAFQASTIPVPLLPVSLANVGMGEPMMGDVAVIAEPEFTAGVWEVTPGVVTDTEVDEIFVVLTGRAVVEIEGEEQPLILLPGSVGRLRAGARTTWRVSETLRKVYVIGPQTL